MSSYHWKPLPIVGRWYTFAGMGPWKIIAYDPKREIVQVSCADPDGQKHWIDREFINGPATVEGLERFRDEGKARGYDYSSWIGRAIDEVAAHEKEFADGR